MAKNKVSFLIPARHEIYLQETIDNILENAVGDFEVIVVLDGYWPDEVIKDDPRVILLHRERRGMRHALNAAAAIAKGKYLLKLDAHCAIAPGFNKTLMEYCKDGYIIVPRRYSLENETWTPRRHRRMVDYEYLCHPDANKGRMHGKPWADRLVARIDKQVDENMTFQGSCWMMTKKHFERLGGFNDDGYGVFICEAQEIGLKTWLGGGKVLIDKRTWYAHLWKGQPYRDKFKEMYGKQYTRVGHKEYVNGNKYNTDFWMNNRWEERIHDFEWLIRKFAPVPTWEGKI